MARNPIKCFDNGGKTADRYTVVYISNPEKLGLFYAVGMSMNPFHPQGFCCHTTAVLGPHLGRRIIFAKLPEECQRVVLSDLRQLAV